MALTASCSRIQPIPASSRGPWRNSFRMTRHAGDWEKQRDVWPNVTAGTRSHKPPCKFTKQYWWINRNEENRVSGERWIRKRHGTTSEGVSIAPRLPVRYSHRPPPGPKTPVHAEVHSISPSESPCGQLRFRYGVLRRPGRGHL